MSNNKMGVVPSHTRDALYKMLLKVGFEDDKKWATAIARLTALGPDQALKKLNAPLRV